MELDDNERRRIESALEDLNDRSPLDVLQTPIEYHYFVWHYNWDGGIKRIRDIVTSKNCDRGTALLAYWLSGPFVCGHPTQVDCTDYEKELFDCIQALEGRLLADDFLNRDFAINPRNLSFEGDDWTQITFDRVPPVQLTMPTAGTPLPEDDLTYELTAEDIARREAFAVQEDLESLKMMAEKDPAYRDNLLAYQRWLAERDA